MLMVSFPYAYGFLFFIKGNIFLVKMYHNTLFRFRLYQICFSVSTACILCITLHSSYVVKLTFAIRFRYLLMNAVVLRMARVNNNFYVNL